MTDDLISRGALLVAYDQAHKGPPGGARKLILEAPAANETQVILEGLRIMREICKGNETCLDCPADDICGFFAGSPCKWAFDINRFAGVQYAVEKAKEASNAVDE